MATATADWTQYAKPRAPAIPAAWAAADTAHRASLAPAQAPSTAAAAAAPYTGAGSLPNSDARLAQMSDLQSRSLTGLQALASRDTTAKKKAVEDALYASQAESIGSAADLQRRKMLEGTFGRGVGSSSITVDLAGRLAQEEGDALARARREAFLGAEAEDRANLAAELALHNAGFGAATTGMQADMNVILQNLARQQQESQFGRNLDFQRGEGAANRAQSANLFGQDLAFRNRQLDQQASQFSQNLNFLGGENAANRSHALDVLGRQQGFMGEQNDLTRQLQMALAQMGFDFQGNQAQLNRDFTASQNQASRDLQRLLTQMGFDFQGSQSQLARDLQRYMFDQGQTFTGNQAQLNRDAALNNLLLQIANSQDLAGQQALISGLPGLGDLIGRILQGLA